VWLRAEKPRKQGPSSGAGLMLSGFPQGRFSGKTSSGGKIQTEMEETVIGGNPKPNQHSQKVSTNTNPKMFQFLPKLDVNEVIAEKCGFMGSMGSEGIAGDSQGKKYLSHERGQPAQIEKMRVSGQFKWVQKEVTGPLTIGPKQEGKPGEEMGAQSVKIMEAPVSPNLRSTETRHSP
jgi:hypothetical protein